MTVSCLTIYNPRQWTLFLFINAYVMCEEGLGSGNKRQRGIGLGASEGPISLGVYFDFKL